MEKNRAENKESEIFTIFMSVDHFFPFQVLNDGSSEPVTIFYQNPSTSTLFKYSIHDEVKAKYGMDASVD